MTTFIVRPFGVKNGVDFEKVDRELISPALDRLQLTGRTTQEIAAAGNIRADMFQLLLTSDIVIADISIHNANVFYELGVRHALRDKWTVLIRASIEEVPFDLKTDRYLAYDAANPGSALPALLDTLGATKRSKRPDSPVYSMLPGLKAPDPSVFIVVPQDFREEVRRAYEKKEKGDLRFLASELTGLRWRREGLRVIGEAQFRLGDRKHACETWEAVRAELPDDIEANMRLGTLYQKCGDLIQSDEALQRVVGNKDQRESYVLAEAGALLGSNAKTRWLQEWQSAKSEDRQAEALRSPLLLESLKAYRKGFEADPSHHYSGLNALALVTILTELAEAQPTVWLERFHDEEEAAFKLREYRSLRVALMGAVDFALRACQQRLEREDKQDEWLAMSFADHAFLCGKANAAALYREAGRTLGPFGIESAGRQFSIFQSLTILKKSVDACAPVFAAHASPAPSGKAPHVLLFTGHRVDDRKRAKPRFPPNQEGAARAAIRKAIENELPSDGSPVICISGSASGGDTLFLEECEALGLERRIYLIVSRDEYVKESVAPSGAGWIERFNHQYDTAAGRREYQRSTELPVWLQDKKDYSVWQRSNAWMLYNALAIGGTNTTLIALWDGKPGDGPGGTEHMVREAEARGAGTIILDTNELFGITPERP